MCYTLRCARLLQTSDLQGWNEETVPSPNQEGQSTCGVISIDSTEVTKFIQCKRGILCFVPGPFHFSKRSYVLCIYIIQLILYHEGVYSSGTGGAQCVSSPSGVVGAT